MVGCARTRVSRRVVYHWYIVPSALTPDMGDAVGSIGDASAKLVDEAAAAAAAAAGTVVMVVEEEEACPRAGI